jgi:hypothetical protein
MHPFGLVAKMGPFSTLVGLIKRRGSELEGRVWVSVILSVFSRVFVIGHGVRVGELEE